MTVPSVKIFPRNVAIRALLAVLAISTASAATRSGQITANPEVVVIPSGASSGTTLISWTTVNCAVAQVTVTAAGGTEQLFGDATSFLNSPAPWIGLNTFTFRLYGDRTRTLLLDSVVVTGVRAASGSITASPLNFALATAGATFSTTLSWTTSDGLTGRVTRSTAGGGHWGSGQGTAGFRWQIALCARVGRPNRTGPQPGQRSAARGVPFALINRRASAVRSAPKRPVTLLRKEVPPVVAVRHINDKPELKARRTLPPTRCRHLAAALVPRCLRHRR